METEKKKNKKIELIDLLIFSTIILIFSIALLAFYPALMTSDNVDQMQQALTGKYKGAHPVFHTIILFKIAKIFGSVSAAAIFQILVFAIVWTWGCKSLRKENNSFKNKVFQYIATIIIVALPLNFLYSITLWKDILYSYSCLALIICIYNFIQNKFKLKIQDIILLTLSLIFVSKFRHNGPIVGVPIFVVLFIINFLKQKNIKISLIFLASFVLLYLIAGIPEKVLLNTNTEADSSEKSICIYFNGTILHAMGAILTSDIEIEQEDLEFLNNILDIETWKENYNPSTAGGIHYNPKLNKLAYLSKEDNDRFGRIFIKYTKKKPMVIIKHFVKLNTIDWSIKEYYPLHSVITNNGSISEMSNGKYDTETKSVFLNKVLFEYTVMTLSNSTIYMLIYRPATAMIISIILIGILVINKRKREYLLILLPMLLNIAPYIIIITSQDQRYFYPSFMTCYFSIMLLITVYTKTNTKTKKVKKNEDIKKILLVLHAYNCEKSIKEFINKEIKENYKGDILVINNNSQDNTKEEILKTKSQIINLPNKLMINNAFQCGYMYAYQNNYDAVVQITENDNPKYIKKMIKILKEQDVDMVIGSRFIEGKKHRMNIIQNIKNKFLSFVVKFNTDKKIYDVSSKYKAVNKDLIYELCKNSHTDVTMISKTILNKNKIKEISI